MFGLGFGEIILIVFFILIFFGSKEIPDLARTIAKIIKQVKHASNELKHEITSTIDVEDVKQKIGLNDIQNEINQAKASVNDEINQSSKELKQTVEEFENLTGPIKRMK